MTHFQLLQDRGGKNVNVIVNKVKALIAFVMVLFFGGYSLNFALSAEWLPALVFVVIAALFFIVFMNSAGVVHIDDQQIRLTFFGMERRRLAWTDVKEVGLIGENVFNRGKKYRSGDKYLYFSPIKLTADERFDMIVSWPPKDKIYAGYSAKLLAYAMSIWNRELETYNVEDLYANSAEPSGAKKPQP